MAEEFKVGDRVRIKRPERYIKAVEAKVRDRVGTVILAWIPQGRFATCQNVKVEFDARRKGSPTFIEVFHPGDLECAGGS